MAKKRTRRQKRRNVTVAVMILRCVTSSAAGRHVNRSLDVRKGRLRKVKHRKAVQDDT